jgi:hypothetical protein
MNVLATRWGATARVERRFLEVEWTDKEGEERLTDVTHAMNKLGFGVRAGRNV